VTPLDHSGGAGAVATVLGAEAGHMDGLAVVLALAASVGLIVLNGFYVAYEFAILAAKRSSFEDGTRPSRIDAAARASLSDVSMQLAGAQLGITIASLALGRISEPALEVLIERVIGTSIDPETSRVVGVVVSLGVFTVLHLVFGEMVPKNVALAAPDATLRWLVLPYRLYLWLFRPVVQLLNGMANLASRAIGIQPRDELQSVHTASELAAIVAHSSAGGAIEADDAEILQGVIEFAQRPVREVATPLDEHPSVNLGATAGQLEQAVASGGMGRVLVLDPRQSSRPIGYLHARDLLEIPAERRSAPVPAALVRNMALVQADSSLVDVLLQLRRLRRHLALVQSADGPIAVVSQEQVVRALIQRRPIDMDAPLPEHHQG
jgi:CBS domain containing-hemolysin-like protein